MTNAMGLLVLLFLCCVTVVRTEKQCGCSTNRYSAVNLFSINTDTLFEGDMKLSVSQQLARRGFRNTVSRSDEKWPEGELVYRMNHPNSRNIKKALNNLSKRTGGCITFREKERTDMDYVNVIYEDGCWSAVGRRGGKQDLSLGEGCESITTIQHEFMHALGFDHEQSRKDRGKHIRINWRNIETGNCHNFKTWGQIPNEPYDIKSIMHYGAKDFSCNGEDTIVAVDKKRYRISSILTKIDVRKIKRVYNCQ